MRGCNVFEQRAELRFRKHRVTQESPERDPPQCPPQCEYRDASRIGRVDQQAEVAERRDGTVAYWEAGDMAYALTGKADTPRLMALAERIAPAA